MKNKRTDLFACTALTPVAKAAETKEKTMTTKELASAFGVDVRTINNAVARLSKENLLESTFQKTKGRPTKVFTEKQAVLIKQEIAKHHNLETREIDTVISREEIMQNIATALKQANELVLQLQNEKQELQIQLDENEKWCTLMKYFNLHNWKSSRSQLSRLSRELGEMGYERKKIPSIEYPEGLWSYRLNDLDEYFSEDYRG